MGSDECMFIAGDPSGDKHSAPVVRQLKRRYPNLAITGIGGPHMQREGFLPLLPFEPFNKMGLVEVLRHLPFFLGAKKWCINYLKKNRPRCLVCVDYSGFNIPMMKAAAKLQIPVVWYIAPMVWAWKKKRAAILGKYAAHICCLFPFEVPYFKPYTDNVHFVGNPVVEDLEERLSGVKVRTLTPDTFSVVFVPGSRVQEVTRLLPVMVAVYKLLKQEYPMCRGTISKHPSLDFQEFEGQIEGTDLLVTSEPLTKVLIGSDLAVVTSGTATLETALVGTPHVIVYKASPVTYAIMSRLVSLPNVGLPNIIAQETVAPELIQQYVTDNAIMLQLKRFIEEPLYYQKTSQKLMAIRDSLGSVKPSESVAEVIASVFK